jgi:hypothetical protein
LLTESQVFEDETLPGTESADHPPQEIPEQHDHGKNLIGTNPNSAFGQVTHFAGVRYFGETHAYFGPDGLLRRHAYTVDVMGGAAGLNYASDYRYVDGIVVPTKRRVYAPDGNKQKISEPVLVAIDIRDIAFSAD